MDSDSLPQTLSSPARTTLEQSLVSTGNTTHSGCRVLCSGGPKHSKPFVFIVFLHLDRTNLSYPRVHSPSGLRRVHSATRLGLPPDTYCSIICMEPSNIEKKRVSSDFVLTYSIFYFLKKNLMDRCTEIFLCSRGKVELQNHNQNLRITRLVDQLAWFSSHSKSAFGCDR